MLREILDHVPVHPDAHGFTRGRSVISHAGAHVGRPVLLALDLRDFFASISAGRVYGTFRTIGYAPSIAHVLTGLCTNVVPQTVWEVVSAAAGADARRDGRTLLARAPAGDPAPATGRAHLARTGQPGRVRARSPAVGTGPIARTQLLTLRRRPDVLGLHAPAPRSARDRGAGGRDRPRRGLRRQRSTRPRCAPAARARRSAGSSSTTTPTSRESSTTGSGRCCTTPPATARRPTTVARCPTSRPTSAAGSPGCRRSTRYAARSCGGCSNASTGTPRARRPAVLAADHVRLADEMPKRPETE